MASNLQIRMIESNDLPMIEAWAQAHGRELNPWLLPRLGVLGIDVAGPCGAMWLRMDNSIGVAYLDAPVSRPGLSLKATRGVLRQLLAFLECEARTLGYGFIMSFVPEALAREACKLGYVLQATELTMISKSL